MNNDRSLTIQYAAVQACFWSGLCIYLGFVSVYFLGMGSTNARLGAVIAAGSLAGSVVPTVLSDLIDRSSRVSASSLMMPVLLAETASIAAVSASQEMNLLTEIFFILYITFGMSVNSLNLKLYIDAEKAGASIDYGVSRAAGSLAYVALSFVLGLLITRLSFRVIPAAGVVICVMQMAAFLIFSRKTGPGSSSSSGGSGRGTGLGEFIRSNRRFCLMLAGAALLFYSHNTVCNYLINAVNNVGAGAGEMGFLNGFMAAVEIPVMVLYTRLFGGRDTDRIMKVAFIFFGLKGIAIAAAGSFPALVCAFALQAPSFALYTAAVVPYTLKAIPPEDQAKAQSLVFSMTTIGSLLSGSVSGHLYDSLPAGTVLWIAAAAGVLGAAAAAAGVSRRRQTA